MVKLRSDQERVKALLKETITLLCKNGLEYKTRFCVDALIGITLDEDDVFLVKITETVGEKTVGNGAPVHLPPAPAPIVTIPSVSIHQSVLDLQSLKSSSFSTIQENPLDFHQPSTRESPMPVRSSQPVHHPSEEAVQQAPISHTPSNDRKRRASSSPVHPSRDQSPDIPNQRTQTPGAISNASDLSNHSVSNNELTPTPISVQPIDTEEDMQEDEQPQNLVKPKETKVKQEPKGTVESDVQDAPLNMSTFRSPSVDSSSNKADSCSAWDPAKMQQQAAQAAAAAFVKSEVPKLTSSPSPTGSNTEQQDASSWSLLHNQLKTKQKGGRQPEEDGMNYFYAVSNPSYSLEKRYVCDFAGCNYTSSRKYNLMRHGRTHHEDQRIPCPECPGTFVDKYILKEHMASAHAKFTVPIEGTNMIGVGIGNTAKGEDFKGGSPTLVTAGQVTAASINSLTPTNKRKRSIPSHNPSPRRSTGSNSGQKFKTPSNSPAEQPKRSGGGGGGGGGWHIPRLLPMGTPSSPGNNVNNNKDAQKLNEGDESLVENNNNILSKDSMSSMQIVFPGMDIMDIDNNNTPKEPSQNNKEGSPAEEGAQPDLSTGMQVVFPGMEIVQQEESNGLDSSPEKERSIIETSDGEEAKISE